MNLLEVGAPDFIEACKRVRGTAKNFPWLFVIGWDDQSRAHGTMVVAGVRVKRPSLRHLFRRRPVIDRGQESTRRPPGTCGLVVGRRADGVDLVAVSVRHVDGSIGVYHPDELEPAIGRCSGKCPAGNDRVSFRSLFRRHRPKCSRGNGVRGLCTD